MSGFMQQTGNSANEQQIANSFTAIAILSKTPDCKRTNLMHDL